jgi:hypothetical protein
MAAARRKKKLRTTAERRALVTSTEFSISRDGGPRDMSYIAIFGDLDRPIRGLTSIKIGVSVDDY